LGHEQKPVFFADIPSTGLRRKISFSCPSGDLLIIAFPKMILVIF